MSLDMAKYRRIFLEEATDHLGEISHALLSLEKELEGGEAIDTVFRMAHSIKSMAASLGFDPIADLAHRMEDRMEGVRSAGRVRDHAELAVLFRALEALEAMVAAVADDREAAPAEASLLEALATSPSASTDAAPQTTVARAAETAAVAAPPGIQPKKVRR
ncbi:Hpt domain-containing protein [Myxococcota bacterium]|nr:Hpt domain-containing protein [Myxococcota bacterium]